MCTVLPLKKRSVVTVASPLDLTLKKKKSASPERSMISPPVSAKSSSASSLDGLSCLSLDMQQIQLTLLQQLYFAQLISSSCGLPSLLPTPLPTPALPTVLPKASSPKCLPLEHRKTSSSKAVASPGDDKRCEANARERNRVQNLGLQFEKLRTLLPVDEQRLSKLTILKVAKAYIAYLAVLSTSDSELEMEAAGIIFQATSHQEMQPRR